MVALRSWFDTIYLVDFEYGGGDGNRPIPRCMVAREVWSGHYTRVWFPPGEKPPCPLRLDSRSLYVAYYASAEIGCHLALGWPTPSRVLDLCAEFRCRTSGLSVGRHRLVDAMTYFGLNHIPVEEKEAMVQLALAERAYTADEQRALLDYCQSDVDALAALLPAMYPRLDIPAALFRGRYMTAAAHIERQGIPVDLETWEELQASWESIRTHIALALNQTHPVFIPKGQRPLHPHTPFGRTILQTAATRQLNPYLLANAAEMVWREERERAEETRLAQRQARQHSGLTPAGIARWERSGRDHSTWPGLDVRAHELALAYPAALVTTSQSWGDDIDYGARLWDLVREPAFRLPEKHATSIVRQACELLRPGELEDWTDSPLVFSTQCFTWFLHRHHLAWPRLADGRLALDEQTFKDMARIYPQDISPIREVRSLLADLRRVPRLALGSDGRNRTLLGAFRSKTGRNQPSAGQYLFGQSSWLRFLIQPQPGRAVAYIDWSQQELAIAAYLSGDRAMQAAYQSGDFYLTWAKMVGKAPQEATKASHATIREQFKVVALGVLFGMSLYGAARKLDIPTFEARDLLQAHQAAFPQFWRWSQYVADHAFLKGYLRTKLRWYVYTIADSTERSMRNFPMQATGADMMRVACCLTTERGLHVAGVVHDALLVEAAANDIDAVVAATQALMREASLVLLPGFPLRSEVQIVRYPERFHDPRGERVWGIVQELLSQRQARDEVWSEEVPF